MNDSIQNYNNLQIGEEKSICDFLMMEINKILLTATGKIWHGHPVWFLDENPIVGYSKLKNCIQLLFWSGQSFEENKLTAMGKFKAAGICYTKTDQINPTDLNRWLNKAKQIQWDYKNIVKHKGVLERFK